MVVVTVSGLTNGNVDGFKTITKTDEVAKNFERRTTQITLKPKRPRRTAGGSRVHRTTPARS